MSEDLSLRRATIKELVFHSTLLAKVNQSRGEPTKTNFADIHDLDIMSLPRLRRDFLDHFALICSTSKKGAETATAVCLEQHRSPAVLRIARNSGISSEDLTALEKIVEELRIVARKEKHSRAAEATILDLVVDLDQDRIVSLLHKVERQGLLQSIQQGTPRLLSQNWIGTILAEPDFRLWMQRTPFGAIIGSEPSAERRKALITWASEARSLYSRHLEALLGYRRPEPPKWLEDLHKLGRYRVAVRSMIKLAIKQAPLFQSIRIEAIKAPPQEHFTVPSTKSLLRNELQKLFGKESNTILGMLKERWRTEDAESYFKNACPPKLCLHAEMQMLDFYVLNPNCLPSQRFMGISKKACFLCHEYLSRHPLKFQVSACHQKVYNAWMPPPCYEKSQVWKFNRLIKNITMSELKTDLKNPQRLMAKDSTAGPSMTTTATILTSNL